MAYTTIDNPEAYFQAVLYAGNSSTQSITLGGDEDMQPDLVWIKARSDAGEHTVYDSVRGATKRLDSADTGAEDTVTNGVTAFDSDGFSLGAGGNENSATTIVAWNWKESATAGFDIVAYQGNSTTRTISHDLSAVPHCILIMPRTNAGYGKSMYHHKNTAAPETDVLVLNTTAATTDNADYWNDTAPTSSVFTLDTLEAVNENGGTRYYIAYLWTSIQGYSKFGSYIGGSDPFVYLGFRPAFIMFKNASATENWRIIDNKRDTYNPAVAHIYPNLSNAEGSGASYSDYCDILSNGFKIISGSGEVDGSGNTITYMAFAEAPFVNSNGVPCNAR